ncbi:MAG TPA: sugar ABC transporter substrate-binding protein [Spirochaetia bacterium]
MRKIPIVLAVVVLTLSLAACGGGAKRHVEIVGMIQSSPEAQFVKSIAEDFNADPNNGGITVTINELGRDNVFPRIQTQLFAKSTAVDFVFITPSLIGPLGAGGVLEDLNPYFTKKAAGESFTTSLFSKGGIDAGTYAGSLYGLPFVTSTMLLFYRTDLIKTPPQTWDEYYQLARKFTKSLNPASPTVYGTTVMGKPQQDAINVDEYSQIAWSMGGDFVGTDASVNVSTPQNVKALELWTNLYRNKLVPPDATSFDYPAVLAAFQEGQTAMCIQWDAAAGSFADPKQSPKIYDKFAVAAIPGTKQADGTILRQPYLNFWLSSVNKFSGKKEQTFKFLSYLYDPKEFTKRLTPNMTTALKDVLASDEFRAIKQGSRSYDAYKQSLLEGRTFNAHKELDKIKSILDSALSQALAGSETPQQALEGAQSNIASTAK